MIRPIAIEFALFLTPFALYAAFLWATRAGVLHPDAWSTQRVALLAMVALVLMIAGFTWVVEFTGGAPDAAYVPPHLENGKLVPGTVK